MDIFNEKARFWVRQSPKPLTFRPRIQHLCKPDSRSDDKLKTNLMSGVTKISREINTDGTTQIETKNYLVHLLTEIGIYIAKITGDECKKKQNPEIGKEELERTVTLTFPQQLRLHAILNASENVAKYIEGFIVYQREPEKSIKRKARSVTAKKTKQAFKGPTSVKHRRPVKKSSSKNCVGKKKTPSSHKNNIIQAPAPKKSVFVPLFNITIHGQFDNVVVVLDKEASNSSGGMLEDVCEALMKVALSRAENSGKLGQEQVVEAVCQVFPKQLADHSIASGLNRNES
ncbi:hypothetical protein AVEN_50426-1 [Araneus ventricosus]|uniref:Uncharacterized protein n=1 Tax=Araneus ventricosus TaxID=182803 RepID=A0A4Y2EQY0_ARAVE|nr:hypothetical protein AVEN_50426-1 [Araneus ventricosus]